MDRWGDYIDGQQTHEPRCPVNTPKYECQEICSLVRGFGLSVRAVW